MAWALPTSILAALGQRPMPDDSFFTRRLNLIGRVPIAFTE
jgi:hypothetical protein